MTITRAPLDERDKEDIQALFALFLDGECYAFAAALRELTGYEMVALRTREHPVRHVAVRDDQGRLYDARGLVSEEAFGKPFYASMPYDLRVVTLDELRKIRPVDDRIIARAISMIEVAWPELVRFPSELSCRLTLFLRDFEELCRRHKFWIHEQYPGASPRISTEQGDERGYVWRTNVLGSTHTFTTLLSSKKDRT